MSAKAALFFACRSEGSAKAIIIFLLSHGDNNNYRLGSAVGSAATCAPLPVGRRAERCRLKPPFLYPLSLALAPFAPLGGTIVMAVLSGRSCEAAVCCNALLCSIPHSRTPPPCPTLAEGGSKRLILRFAQPAACFLLRLPCAPPKGGGSHF